MVSWTIAPEATPADGRSAVQVGLALTTPFGAPVQQAKIVLSSDQSDDRIVQPALTDAQGKTQATIVATVAGVHTLTAAVDDGFSLKSLSALGQVPFSAVGNGNTAQDGNTASPNTALSVQILATHSTAAADPFTPTQITLTVVDGAGKPVAGQVVTITTQRPGDTVVPATAVTDAQGRVLVSLTAGSLGDAVVQAQVGNVVVHATIFVVAGTPDVAHSVWLARSPNAVANGQDVLPFDLLLRDALGHPVPYVEVSFVSDNPHDVLSPVTVLTDASGMAAMGLSGTAAGQRTVSASVHQGTLTAQGLLMAGPPSLPNSPLTASPNVLSSDSTQPIALALTVRDAFNNPVPAVTITPGYTGGAWSITPTAGSTDANGLWTATFQSFVAANANVIASYGALTSSTAITILAGAPNATNSSVTLSPTSLLGDGNATALYAVTLKDAYDNVVTGAPVSLTASGANTLISPMSGNTDGNGLFTALLSSHTVQTESISYAASGASGSANVTFTVGPISAATTTLTASPSTGVLSNSTATSTITLTARDAASHPLSGYSVVFSKPSEDTALSGTTGTTSAAGTSSITMTARVAGPRTVVARVGSLVFTTAPAFSGANASCGGNMILGTRPSIGVLPDALQFIQAADMDNDGYPEIVGASHSNPNIYIFSLNSAGYITSTTIWSLPASPGYVPFVITELNNDGHKDVVTTGAASLVTYLGSASTILDAATIYNVGNNLSIVGLCSADLDGDGYNDIVAISNYGTIGFYTIISNHSGGYSSQTLTTLTGAPLTCVAQDLDADGYIDIAIVNPGNNDVEVFPGNSSHTFSAQQTYSVSTSPIWIAAGLLNNDTIPDIVTISDDGSSTYAASVLIGKSGGGYQTAVNYSLDMHPQTMQLVDMNKDNKLDIVVANGLQDYGNGKCGYQGPGNNINILYGNGDGTFQALKRVGSGTGTYSLAVGDFDRSGTMDIAYVGFGMGSPVITYQNADTSFYGINAIPTCGSDNAMTAVDLNNDGYLDIASTTYQHSSVDINLNQGDGNFTPWSSGWNITYGNFYQIDHGDYNGDGNMDLFIAQVSNPCITILTGVGDGTTTFSTYVYNQIGTNVYENMFVGDVNGDGLDDVLIATPPYINVLLASTSSPPFTTTTLSAPSSVSDCRAGKVVDLNNDGYADVVISCKGGAVMMWGDGTGTNYQTSVNTNLSNYGGVDTSDINEDGFVDAVFTVGTSIPGTAQYFLNDGTGNLVLSGSLTVPNLYINFTVRVVDLDGDGHGDIVAKTTGPGPNWSGPVYTWLGKGTGAFSGPFIYGGGVSNGFEVGDVNKDGRMDIMVDSEDAGLQVYMNRGCGP